MSDETTGSAPDADEHMGDGQVDDATDGGDTVDDLIRVRRAAHRAVYDRSTIDAIIDEALIAHVGTVRDGVPVVIPMFAVRDGDDLLLHGAPAAGVLRRGSGSAAGAATITSTVVCATLTLLDGLVLARSAFHHSMNYRSVVIIGEATEVTEPTEKERALDAFTERLVPGRLDDLRPMTDKEVRGTSVLRLPLDRASAKVCDGWPIDDEEDESLPIWAGVVPVARRFDPPLDDPKNLDGVVAPDSVVALASDPAS